MNFQQSIEACFNKYATFSGRASRSEYWFFILFTILVSFVGTIFDLILFESPSLFPYLK